MRFMNMKPETCVIFIYRNAELISLIWHYIKELLFWNKVIKAKIY